MDERPLGIIILAILAIIGVIYYTIAMLLMPLINAGFSHFVIYLWLIGIIMVMLLLLIAYGFLKGLRWSWFLALIIIIINLIGSIVSMLTSYQYSSLIQMFIGVISLFVGIAILFYLTRPHVKKYFGVDSSKA